MFSEIADELILFTFTFLANLLASVSGGGAGFVQLPLLILMGLPFATALGTHKVSVVFLGIGALAKQRHTHLDLDRQVALIMLFIGCPSVALGSLIIINVPDTVGEILLGIITVAAGIYTLFKKEFGAAALPFRSVKRTIAGALCLCVIGLMSGSLSSGAGLFATMSLVMVFGLELKRAILHTMVFVAAIWNLVGAFTIGAVAAIYWHWIPVMILASFSGAYCGTTLLIKLPSSAVKVIFSCVAVFSGLLLLYTALA